MRHTLLVILVAAATCVALGQTSNKVATLQTDKKIAKAGIADEEALMKIEQELVDALVRGDTKGGERYLAEDFFFSAPDGTVSGKAQFINDLKSGDLKIASSANDDMKVRVYGNTAVLTYRSTDKGTYKGNDLSGQYRWTDVFVKHGGKWQIVSTHGTRIRQPQGQ
jgi:ketosteroid isomerase-like protein